MSALMSHDPFRNEEHDHKPKRADKQHISHKVPSPVNSLVFGPWAPLAPPWDGYMPWGQAVLNRGGAQRPQGRRYFISGIGPSHTNNAQ